MLGDLSHVDVDRLKAVRIEAITSDTDMPIYVWPLFRCFYCELQQDGRTYVLNSGRWFEVETDFARVVSEACRMVPAPEATLPEYQDRSEADYNQRVAFSDPSRFVSLDRRTVVFPVSPSRIEFCDLYTVSREMIFVKKYGYSNVLSHLFAQGVVSAETFRRERSFRELVERHLPPTHRLGERVAQMTPQDFTVIFAIVSDSARPLHESLPFFSKVNLRNATKLLQSNGYNVRLLKIQQPRQNSESCG